MKSAWAALAVVVTAALVATAPSPWYVPSRLLLGPVLVVLSAVDLRQRRLPDRIVLPATAGGLALLALGALGEGSPAALGRAVAGAALFAGLLFVLHLASPSGLGFGDVKLGLLLGSYLGAVSLALVLWGLLAGSLVGAAAGLAVAVRARDRRATLPFGPALAAGAVLALVVAGVA